jgi:hypothetical protein
MRKLLLYLFLVLPLPILAQPVDFWRPILHRETLADTLDRQSLSFSSYDRSGFNDDYARSYGLDSVGWWKLCDAEGPGVCTQFWSTSQVMPPTARWRIYVDDMTHPLIDTTVLALFGNVSPFVPPRALITFWSKCSYVPIPFQSHLKITTDNLSGCFYHFSVYKLPAGSTVSPMIMPPSPNYTMHADSLTQLLSQPEVPVLDSSPIVAQTASITMPVNARQDVVTYTGSGINRRLLILLDQRNQQVHENFWVRVYTDHNPLPDLEGPLSPLFGATHGWHQYQSFGTGTMGDSIYFNLPIVFKTGLRVELENRTADTRTVYFRAEIVEQPAASIDPFRLRSVFRDVNPTTYWSDYEVFDVPGPGNYVGLFWEAENTPYSVLTGDEKFYRDHADTAFWKGTGTEDYFNGGNSWSDSSSHTTPRRFANYGCIDMASGWTSAYRWHFSDAIPFRENLRMTLEVGGWDEIIGHYRTVAFLYTQPARLQVRDASGDGQSFPGEPLHIVGRGLPPGSVVDSVYLGPWGMVFLPGSRTVNADSIVECFALAPAHGHGLYPLTIRVSTASGLQTATTPWLHYSSPKLVFETSHRDTFAFPEDSLLVRIDGIQPGQQAALQVAGLPIPWIAPAPVADAAGVLRGFALVPDSIPDGDFPVTSISPGVENGQSEALLQARHFLRTEIETLPIQSWAGSNYLRLTAPNYNRVGHHDPWGRDRCFFLIGRHDSDFVAFDVQIPVDGFYLPKYMLGLTGGGAIIKVLVDNLPNLPEYNTFMAINDRWERTDTLTGGWYYLQRGAHNFKFYITGHDTASTGWQIVIDQLILDWSPSMPQTAGEGPAVNGLTIHQTTSGVELHWLPMSAEAFDIYCSSHVDGPYEHCAEVSGDCFRYVDSQAVSNDHAARYYYVTARLPIPGLR